ncbi:MAG: methylenetetrahydrofolate reductase [NAD(P)H] [Armatimonadaceae bacterium]
MYNSQDKFVKGRDSMRVDALFGTGMPTRSFEFFPPKTDAGFDSLFETIDNLKPLQPSYVSVTYGAGGSTRRKTVSLAGRIQNEIGLRVMAHLTCVKHTCEETEEIVNELYASGIRNILALRGDPPKGEGMFVPTEGGFQNSTELVAFLRERFSDLCIGVAGYPEGHPQCLNRTRDLEHLKQKVDAGANVVITQLFFDNEDLYRWRDQARQMGIDVPVIAGIMPIENVAQIKRFVTMCGAKIPHPLLQQLEAVEKDPQAVYQLGVEHATRQCQELLERDAAQGIHFYTLNKSRATTDICRALTAKFAA